MHKIQKKISTALLNSHKVHNIIEKLDYLAPIVILLKPIFLYKLKKNFGYSNYMEFAHFRTIFETKFFVKLGN